MRNDLDTEGVFFLVMGLIFCIALFLGVRKFAAYAFKNTPSTSNIEIKKKISKQKERLDQLKRDQDNLMRTRKQRIQDYRNR